MSTDVAMVIMGLVVVLGVVEECFGGISRVLVFFAARLCPVGERKDFVREVSGNLGQIKNGYGAIGHAIGVVIASIRIRHSSRRETRRNQSAAPSTADLGLGHVTYNNSWFSGSLIGSIPSADSRANAPLMVRIVGVVAVGLVFAYRDLAIDLALTGVVAVAVAVYVFVLVVAVTGFFVSMRRDSRK